MLNDSVTEIRQEVTTKEKIGTDDRQWLWWTIVVLAGAFLLRAALVLRFDFPLGDGGLFVTMVKDLQANGYALPKFTTYNDAQIPYAYSPFAFYLAAIAGDGLRMPVEQVFRLLPFLGCCFMVVAFWLLAKAVFADRVLTLTATFFFGFLPRTGSWLIMGGGLTRSFGLAFALLAIRSGYLMYQRKRWTDAAWAGAFAALTVLSHIGTAPVIVVSLALFFLFFDRSIQGLLRSMAAGLMATALALPWILSIVSVHGLETFRAAQATSDSGLRMIPTLIRGMLQTGTLTGEERQFPVIAGLAFMGIFACLTPRYLFLPLWWGAISVLVPRGAETYTTPALAMMAAVAFVRFIVPLAASDVREWPVVGGWRWAPRVVPAFLLAFVAVSAFSNVSWLLVPLARSSRDAMAWASQNTPKGSQFLIFREDLARFWSNDKNAEWFPTLSGRVSMNTAQGYEWLPGGLFRKRVEFSAALHKCIEADVQCAEAAAVQQNATFRYVLIPQRLEEPPLLRSLRADSSYRTVYEAGGAFIFEKLK